MKEKSAMINVPIYDMTLELVVTDDVIKSQKKEPRFTRMGKQKPLSFMGIAMYNEYKFCIILDRRCMDHSLISHEIYHTTHQLLDYCGVKFKVKNHEAFAYLNGYISEFIYNHLKKWKIRIKSSPHQT